MTKIAVTGGSGKAGIAKALRVLGYSPDFTWRELF